MAVSRGSASALHPTALLGAGCAAALLLVLSGFLKGTSPSWQIRFADPALSLGHLPDTCNLLCCSYSSPEKCTEETISEDS